ncbi:hypothetical protein HYV79_00220 [Candidatus Woesearchaeota archaeon]|nr:hypothetical protein [Candidatus Woesearchaeota archaeon]
MKNQKVKCVCSWTNLVWYLLGVLVIGLGLWGMLNAVLLQVLGETWYYPWLWYSVSVLLLCVGKCMKCKPSEACQLHRNM